MEDVETETTHLVYHEQSFVTGRHSVHRRLLLCSFDALPSALVQLEDESLNNLGLHRGW